MVFTIKFAAAKSILYQKPYAQEPYVLSHDDTVDYHPNTGQSLGFLVFALCSIFAIGSSVQAAPAADPVLAQLTKEAATYAKTTFEVTIFNAATADNKRETRLMHFDPAKPAGKRVELLRLNDKAPTPDQLKEFAKDMENFKAPSGYGIVAGLLTKGNLVKVSENADHIMYRIDKLPADAIQSNQGNFSDKMFGELSVLRGDHGYVDSVTFTASKPFRAKLVASISSMQFVTKYKRRDNGQIIPTGQTQVIRGSAFGKSLDTDSDSKFTNIGNIISR